VITALDLRLRRKIRAHIRDIGFAVDRNWGLTPPADSKEAVRSMHARQRRDRLDGARAFLQSRLEKVLPHFASGHEVQPQKIRPELELVKSSTPACDLFRIASLTWSVPVSQGYGRRMRFLVWDRAIHKLIGIIALGDPVFNLAVRDEFIGWSAQERSDRLVDVMDAYVLGAVPPYSFILGGKLIASLLRTTDIRDFFLSRYGHTRGVISKKRKRPSLVMITTTSALGRSSVYNRVSLDGTQYLQPLGFTGGYGHFHVDGDLFGDIRQYLKARKHPYAADYRFGKGPNWKFRAIRAAFELLGVDRGVLHHGLKRQVFASLLAKNAEEVLRNGQAVPDYSDLLSAAEVSELAIDRWLCPRAARRPEFASWQNDHIRALL
jgi:hypothetical protein